MSPEEIRRLAALARLDLSEAEEERMAGELGSILSHLAALARLPPDGPEADPGGEERRAPLRPDRVGFDPLRARPGEIAPAWADGFFVVPRLAALDGPGAAEGEG